MTMGTSKNNNNQHIHKVKKSGPMWRCVRDNCRFFVYYKQQNVLEGKTCKCWTCASEFTFSELNFDEDFPICAQCRMGDLSDFVNHIEKEAYKKQADNREALFQEMDRLRDEMTGDVDDDILEQIARQNLAGRNLNG